jgi:CMP/dCMP kinase
MRMSYHIITVGRYFGSNGRSIAKRLTDELGIAFYDKDLIAMVAEKIRFQIEEFQVEDEKSANP